MTGGWSSYLDSGKKSKLHFFYKDEGKSVCGMVYVTDKRVKNKFITDDLETYLEKKICKLCQYRMNQ